MKKDNLVYLRHILDAIHRIEEYTEEVNYENFINNNLVQAAVMRDKLIHDYFGVDIDAVWDTILKDIPELKSRLEDIVKMQES